MAPLITATARSGQPSSKHPLTARYHPHTHHNPPIIRTPPKARYKITLNTQHTQGSSTTSTSTRHQPHVHQDPPSSIHISETAASLALLTFYASKIHPQNPGPGGRTQPAPGQGFYCIPGSLSQTYTIHLTSPLALSQHPVRQMPSRETRSAHPCPRLHPEHLRQDAVEVGYRHH